MNIEITIKTRHVTIYRGIVWGFLIAAVSLTTAGAQEIAVIQGYVHPECGTSSEKRHPQYAGQGYRSEHRNFSSCEDTIQSGIVTCEWAIAPTMSFSSSNTNSYCEEYWTSLVPHCQNHYESQRYKCDALPGGSQSDGSYGSGSEGCDAAKQLYQEGYLLDYEVVEVLCQ